MKKPPCYKCTRRYPGCGCQEWKDWRDEHRRATAALKQEKIADAILLQNRIKHKREY